MDRDIAIRWGGRKLHVEGLGREGGKEEGERKIIDDSIPMYVCEFALICQKAVFMHWSSS